MHLLRIFSNFFYLDTALKVMCTKRCCSHVCQMSVWFMSSVDLKMLFSSEINRLSICMIKTRQHYLTSSRSRRSLFFVDRNMYKCSKTDGSRYGEKERIRWQQQHGGKDCMCEGSGGQWSIRGKAELTNTRR